MILTLLRAASRKTGLRRPYRPAPVIRFKPYALS